MSASDNRAGAYHSVFTHWDARSAVRGKPRRVRSPDEPGRYFSAGLTPTAAHPLVTARGPDQVEHLLVRRLYSYLDFTTVLEQEIVNPVVLRLSRDAYGLELSADMRYDAHKIYCDEAYHALFSVDVKRQVREATGIAAPTAPTPHFAVVIDRLRRSAPADMADLVEFCAAVVSETLISSTLTDIPRDMLVVGFVRDMFADHAADERVHHAYFTQTARLIWPQLDAAVRRRLGPGFADLILAFLLPDATAHRLMLGDMDYSPAQSRQIVEESHVRATLLADVRRAARSTLGLVRELGVLDDPRTFDHFSACGLV
jgi:hypothetical protein